MNTSKIEINENYYTSVDAEMFVCCGEVQYQTYSVETDQPMGCQFCEFDKYEKNDRPTH